MKVLILNCSGNAVPRRTNKIGVNQEKVKALIERGIWARDEELDFRICLAHYAYTYNLSYFLDDYEVLPGWEWEPDKQDTCIINSLVTDFCISLQHEFKSRYVQPIDREDEKSGGHEEEKSGCADAGKEDVTKKFRDEFQDLEEALDAMQAGRKAQTQTVDEYCQHLMPDAGGKDDAKRVVEKMRKNELYQQIKNYYNWLCDSGCPNREQISQLFYEVEESLAMSKFDKECFNEIIRSINRKDLYLAGHIHAYAENEQENILVADKLFSDESDDIRGFIIKMKEDGTKPRYEHRRLS